MKLPETAPTATATKPCKVSLQTGHVKPDDLVVSVKDQKGQPLSHTVNDLGGGRYDVVFTPEEEGEVKLDLHIDGEDDPVPGAPMTIHVDPAPYAKLRKPTKEPTASKPTQLVFDTVNVKEGDIKV